VIATIPARENEITRVEAFGDGMLAIAAELADTQGISRAAIRELLR